MKFKMMLIIVMVIAILTGCSMQECVKRNAYATKCNIEKGMKAETIEAAQPRLNAALAGANANIEWIGESEDKSIPSIEESYKVAQETTWYAKQWARLYNIGSSILSGTFDWSTFIKELLEGLVTGGAAYTIMHAARKKLLKGKDDGKGNS